MVSFTFDILTLPHFLGDVKHRSFPMAHESEGSDVIGKLALTATVVRRSAVAGSCHDLGCGRGDEESGTTTGVVAGSAAGDSRIERRDASNVARAAHGRLLDIAALAAAAAAASAPKLACAHATLRGGVMHAVQSGSRLPGGRQQRAEVAMERSWQARQHVGQPRMRVVTVGLDGGQQAHDRSHARAGSFGPCEQPPWRA